ncbi:major capsid protein [Capybara microvirus Cap3_SP_423]|nr:major capsid protein [Capybara microvirus Cap3_SP_423]
MSSRKQYIKSAVVSKKPFDLSRSALGTLDFGQIVPVFFEEGLPGDKFTVSNRQFARLAPLTFPTYGRCELCTASFYVDYYQLADDFEAWIDGKATYNGKVPYLRYFQAYDLMVFMARPANSKEVSSTEHYDFRFSATTVSSMKYYQLTKRGRFIYKILRGLGYQLINGNGDNEAFVNLKFNAMPLLAFFKAYNDYMTLGTRQNTSILSNILYKLKLGEYENEYQKGKISEASLRNAFDSILLCFDDDYFTTTWEEANSPITDYDIVNQISDGESNYNITFNHRDTYMNDVNPSISNNGLTARQHEYLRKFDEWVRRNQLSSKDIDNIYARFGVKPENMRAKYCHPISRSSQLIMVGDVTATSDTYNGESGMPLGSFAGKGIVQGDDKFSYSPDEFGAFITLAWIKVKPMYTEGVKRHCLRSSCFDYFTPEFDGLGGQALNYLELCGDYTLNFSQDVLQTFGFGNRYQEYRDSSQNDIVFGDMAIDEYMNAWHFDRSVALAKEKLAGHAVYSQGNVLNTYGSPGDSQPFDRIFVNDGSVTQNDHFFVQFYFDVKAFRHVKNFTDVLGFGEGDLPIASNGTNIS